MIWILVVFFAVTGTGQIGHAEIGPFLSQQACAASTSDAITITSARGAGVIATVCIETRMKANGAKWDV